jgi:polyisoprenoid-binding protein YceI
VNKWVKRVLIAIPVLVILVYGPILIYAKVINDPDPAFGEQDARDLAAVTVPASDPPAASDPIVATAPPASATEPAADPSGDGLDGEWTVADGSEFGYRVEEILGGVNTTATGRGSDVTGSLTIDGAAVTTVDVTVQVASIESDNGMRDGQFRGRVMETSEFPEATFVLTAPIELGSVPAEDVTVTATAVGELTMHGVTQPVTFDIEAVRGPQRIAVVGSIPIVFADYGIDNPSTNAVTTEDDGVLEFNLAFERAA